MDRIPDADIEDGTQKYVLIEIRHEGECKQVVRGFRSACYHNDIFQHSKREIRTILPGAEVSCKGGGRIRHRAPDGPVETEESAEESGVEIPALMKDLCASKAPSIAVFGHSLGFGRARHDVTVSILRRHFLTYPADHIQSSDEGY